MPLCFAYGSNMDVAAMALRCPKSRPFGAARLLRHRFAIMPQGFGNGVRDPRGVVHGVLWDIALADMRALDAYERVAQGLYSKIMQPVLKAEGGAARAIVYVGKGEGGRPTAAYMRDVIAAARAWGLPEAYIRGLEALAPRGETREPAPNAPTTARKVRPRYASPLDRPARESS